MFSYILVYEQSLESVREFVLTIHTHFPSTRRLTTHRDFPTSRSWNCSKPSSRRACLLWSVVTCRLCTEGCTPFPFTLCTVSVTTGACLTSGTAFSLYCNRSINYFVKRLPAREALALKAHDLLAVLESAFGPAGFLLSSLTT
ncbi:hypothetical protein BU23DRAFT_288828 [Bimuria novae-zelandiae CBS 107.79]|uniref:Uncharacterized protein n=1 Tax=Bimuria novae-zelandiae CBS 107.79 TaxID=1447943 RepID=A0A6A5URR2_9PLEO|nr:hypothetical protein BU23DRAFT_288828 [Bimuria novae-zelandiae CBS 107.79]